MNSVLNLSFDIVKKKETKRGEGDKVGTTSDPTTTAAANGEVTPSYTKSAGRKSYHLLRKNCNHIVGYLSLRKQIKGAEKRIKCVKSGRQSFRDFIPNTLPIEAAINAYKVATLQYEGIIKLEEGNKSRESSGELSGIETKIRNARENRSKNFVTSLELQKMVRE